MRISDWSSDVCSSDLNIDSAVSAIADGIVRHANRCRGGAPGLNPGNPSLFQLGDDSLGNLLIEVRPIAGRSGGSRSEERSVGKECVSTFRSRWSPYP